MAPPNGSRLSCGAELERSQIKDYLRKRGAVSFKRMLDSRLCQCLLSDRIHRPAACAKGD
jgi:hypothetical protein